MEDSDFYRGVADPGDKLTTDRRRLCSRVHRLTDTVHIISLVAQELPDTRTLKQVSRCPPLLSGAALSGLAFSVAPVERRECSREMLTLLGFRFCYRHSPEPTATNVTAAWSSARVQPINQSVN